MVLEQELGKAIPVGQSAVFLGTWDLSSNLVVYLCKPHQAERAAGWLVSVFHPVLVLRKAGALLSAVLSQRCWAARHWADSSLSSPEE